MDREVGVRSGNLDMVVIDRLWDCADSTPVREGFEGLRHEREITHPAMSTMDRPHRTDWLSQQHRGHAYGYWPGPTRHAYSSLPMLDSLPMLAALAAGRRWDVAAAFFPNQIADGASGAPRMLLGRVATCGQPS